MAKAIAKMLAVLILVIATTAATWFYLDRTGAARQLAAAQRENQLLSQLIERLGREKRIAEIIVTDKRVVDGVTRTTLLFLEADRNSDFRRQKTVTVEGDMVHIAAQVIKFDRDYLRQNDPLRGHSIALFTKIYGSNQAPRDGIPLDDPGVVPVVYRADEKLVTQFEAGLWADFWRMAGNVDYARSRGVHVANGQEVFGPFEPNTHYTITLEAAGGMNLIARRLSQALAD